MLCLHCNAHYLLENPLSSILALHPRIRAVLQYRPCHRICTWLGMYGARTPKPINLWSDDPFVNKLKRTVDACVLKHSAVHSGNLEGLRFRDLGFLAGRSGGTNSANPIWCAPTGIRVERSDFREIFVPCEHRGNTPFSLARKCLGCTVVIVSKKEPLSFHRGGGHSC